MSRILLYRLKEKSRKISACLICQQYLMPEFYAYIMDKSILDHYFETYDLLICKECNKLDNIQQKCKLLEVNDGLIISSLIEYCCKLDQIDIFHCIRNNIPCSLAKNLRGKHENMRFKIKRNDVTRNTSFMPMDNIIKNVKFYASANLFQIIVKAGNLYCSLMELLTDAMCFSDPKIFKGLKFNRSTVADIAIKIVIKRALIVNMDDVIDHIILAGGEVC